MRAHLGSDPLTALLRTDPAHEVVPGGRDERDDHERREQPREDEPFEGQLEDVEAQILVEDRIHLMERRRMPEKEILLPLHACAASGEQSEHDRRDHDDPFHIGLQRRAIALEDLIRNREHPRGIRDLAHDPQVQQQQGGEEDAEDQAEVDPGPDRLPEDLRIAGLVEPHDLCEEGREKAERHDDANDDRDGDDEDSAARAIEPVTRDPDHGAEAYQRVTDTAVTVG